MTETSPSYRQAAPKAWWKRTAYRLTRLILICYVGLLVALVLLESYLVYPGAFIGNRGITADVAARSSFPKELGEPSSKLSNEQSHLTVLTYDAPDGAEINGLLVERPDCKRTVLFFHGNGQHAAWMGDWATRLSDHLQANVLLAEYRGYGDDWGTPNESSLVEDAFAAHDAIKSRYGLSDSQIILYGRSLGGGCAAAVASERGAQVLVLERTFDRLVDVAAAKYPVFPIRMLMRNEFDSIKRLSGYEGPVFQIHGTTDTLIPIGHGRRLHESLTSENKTFQEIPGLGHNDRLPHDVFSKLKRFIDREAPVIGRINELSP